VAAFYTAAVTVRIEQHDALWFAHLGSAFVGSSHTSTVITPRLETASRFGYDGQFYYFIAADPAQGRHYMHVGTTDQSGIRYARITYPILARAASAGSARAVPYALIVLNLLGVLVATGALAAWLRRRGRSRWFALVYGLWPGIVFAVFRDLAEPFVYALVALAALVFDLRSDRRVAAAGVLLALALLGRETALAFALVGAGVLAMHDRSWRRPAWFLGLTVGPMLAWRIALTAWLHVTTLEPAGGRRVLLPFYGMRAWWPWDSIHWLMFWVLDAPLLLVAASALYLLYRRTAAAAALLVLLNVALFIVFVPRTITIDYSGAGRNAAPAVLAAVFLLPALRRSAALAVAAILSPLWFLAIAAALGLSGFNLVTT
jgi:hypothetical protein